VNISAKCTVNSSQNVWLRIGLSALRHTTRYRDLTGLSSGTCPRRCSPMHELSTAKAKCL